MNSSKKYFTTLQVASFCGVNLKTVANWIYNGEIRAYRHHGILDHRISVEDFTNFLNQKDSSLNFEAEKNELKVLVVDGELNVAQNIAQIFKGHGFKPIVADNGLKAAYLIKTEHPQIITMDLNLKSLDGLELLKIINDLQVHQKVWVILISDADELKIQSAIDCGADFYLKKPFSRTAVEKIIDKFYPLQFKKIA